MQKNRMLKAVSVCVATLGIFLIVAADSDDLKCEAPPDIKDATIEQLEENEDTEYTVGTTVNYQCNFGYVSRTLGVFSSICTISELTGEAEWTDPGISCIPRSCGDPGYVIDGRRIGNLFTFPNRVEFDCEEGYRLRGLKTRYCQANGEWSGKLPKCELISCSVPPTPLNGLVHYSSLEYNAELRYECNKGFVLKNDQPRFCTSAGTWSNNEPECIEFACKIPESPEHGSVQLSGEPKVGSLAMYSCDEGTTMVGASTSKCLDSGDWTFDPPKCLKACKITDIHDGEIGRFELVRVSRYRQRKDFYKIQIGESIKSNEAVILRCKPGFTPANRSILSEDRTDEVLCIDGLWNKPMQCQAMTCDGDPPSIENGTPVILNPSFRAHGRVIWYRCDDEFEKKSGHIECDRGTWKGNPPACIDTRCYVNQLNFNGLVKPEVQFIKSRLYLKLACENGYRKTTTSERIACFRGKWDIKTNPCVIETCDDEPPLLTNGKIVSFAREHGSVVHYECDEHFDMVGNSIVRCNAGKWDGEPPICQESVKHVEEAPETIEEYSAERVRTSPSPLHVSNCFCTYDYNKYLINATVHNRKLEPEDRIEKGDVVSFRCLHPGMHLFWTVGLKIYKEVNLTCSTCEEWQRHHLPDCEATRTGDSFIVYNSQMKIRPDGVVEIAKSENTTIQCVNEWAMPFWNPGQKSGITYTNIPHSKIVSGSEQRHFDSAYMEISVMDYQHTGTYDCYYADAQIAYRASRLVLRIHEPEIQCKELQTNTKNGNFTIVYDNDRKVNSLAFYSCKDNTQKLIGSDKRKCTPEGKWSGSLPSCEDITCFKQPIYNGMVVLYTTRNVKVHSIAKFRCSFGGTLVGKNTSVCQDDGTWSNPWPKCEMLEIRCPLIDGEGIFSILYSNDRRINSTATFFCISLNQKVEGCNFVTCQQNGEWSGSYPMCVDSVTCSKFEDTPDLEVDYSDGVRVGSTASFYCSPSFKLLGSSSATCLRNGTWDTHSPMCEPPTCSIETLMFSLPEGVHLSQEPTGEFVPLRTELPLMCEDNLIILGNSFAVCGLEDKWDYGDVQCVPGCRLRERNPSHLLIEPVKEYYRFGDFILLSCPPGEELTSEVERVMCLGKSWSDDFPDCVEVKQTSSSGTRATTRKTT